MILDYDPREGLRLSEHEDFKRLKLRVHARHPRRDIDGMSFVDDRHGKVLIRVLPELLGPLATDAWRQRYSQMLVYAASRGWVNEGEESIRLHIETID